MGALSLPVLCASSFASFTGFVPALYAVSAPISASAAPGKLPPRRQVGSSWDVEAREYLGNAQSEAAVNRALAYLAAHQQSDGHWSGSGRTQFTNEVAITGLCLMAFLAAGHQPGRGRYGVVLSEAVDWLVGQVHMDGSFAPKAVGLIRSKEGTGSGPPMYGHGFALLALAEVYGMTRRHDIKEKLTAAVRLIEDTQNVLGEPRTDGGWRYQPTQGDADLSVTVVQVLGLRGCRNAGIKVSQATIDRAVKYMIRLANADGGFSYQYRMGQSNPARTGAGVLSMYLAGFDDPKNPADGKERRRIADAGLKYLVGRPFHQGNDWIYRDHLHYSVYYVTQAMYQAGGEYWKNWYPNIRNRLVASQDADGSWYSGDFAPSDSAGPDYSTAMGVLVLQVPAGLLPIYQK